MAARWILDSGFWVLGIEGVVDVVDVVVVFSATPP